MSNEKYWMDHEELRQLEPLLKLKMKCVNGPIWAVESPYFENAKKELLELENIEDIYVYTCPFNMSEDICMGTKEDLNKIYEDDMKKYAPQSQYKRQGGVQQ